jgi:olfactory receptor
MLHKFQNFFFWEFQKNQNSSLSYFGHFLYMYLITVFGNLLIILAVSPDFHIHTLMYFFPSNLSSVDICVTSTTIPKLL